MSHDRSNYLLWNGTVRALSLQDQLRVASETGFGKLSVTPLDLTKWQSEGLSPKDMLTMAADLGVKMSHLDPLTRWAPKWMPDNVDPAFHPFLGFSVDDFLRLAETFEVESMSAIGSLPAGLVNRAQLTEAFAEISDRAANNGLQVHLEFIPFWGVYDLNMAWQIIRDADKPNTGIVFDYWHFMRSNPDLELLASIPGDKIASVQLADAAASVPDGRSGVEDCLFHRVPCGEGDFPVTEITRTIHQSGGLRNVGPEIFSAQFDTMTADQIIQSIRDFFPRALQDAGALNGYQAVAA